MIVLEVCFASCVCGGGEGGGVSGCGSEQNRNLFLSTLKESCLFYYITILIQ